MYGLMVYVRRVPSVTLTLALLGLIACVHRPVVDGVLNRSGDSPQLAQIHSNDSVQVVRIASDTIGVYDPGVPLRVREFERDSSGFVVTLVPASATRMGGGGIVRLGKDKKVYSVTLWQ